jgi:hypothetical protein
VRAQKTLCVCARTQKRTRVRARSEQTIVCACRENFVCACAEKKRTSVRAHREDGLGVLAQRRIFVRARNKLLCAHAERNLCAHAQKRTYVDCTMEILRCANKEYKDARIARARICTHREITLYSWV